mgnify:CR=1 FL=1
MVVPLYLYTCCTPATATLYPVVTELYILTFRDTCALDTDDTDTLIPVLNTE